MYCDRQHVELVFGKDNIKKWADLDNNEDSNYIEQRIEYMIGIAQAQIDGRLSSCAYAIPFEDPCPSVIQYITSLQTGVLLYNGRRVVSDETPNQVSAQEKEVDTTINRILADTLGLAATRVSTKPPKIIKDPVTLEDVYGANLCE